MIVAGIDPGIAKCAIAWGDGPEPDQCTARDYPSSPCGREPTQRIARIEKHIARILEDLDEAKPRVILIEQYSFGSGAPKKDKKDSSRSSQLAYAGEWRSILYWHLTDITRYIYEVSPGTHKKFVTGSGRADKTAIVKCLTQRGYDLDSDDCYDAVGFFRMALAATGLMETPFTYQQEAIATAVGDDVALLAQLAEPPAF